MIYRPDAQTPRPPASESPAYAGASRPSGNSVLPVPAGLPTDKRGRTVEKRTARPVRHSGRGGAGTRAVRRTFGTGPTGTVDCRKTAAPNRGTGTLFGLFLLLIGFGSVRNTVTLTAKPDNRVITLLLLLLSKTTTRPIKRKNIIVTNSCRRRTILARTPRINDDITVSVVILHP